MTASATVRIAASLALVAGLAAGRIVHATDEPSAADPHAAHRAAMQSRQTTASETRVVLPDVVLLDARAKPFRLRPDAFRGRIVVVDFIFTRCTTICPALSTVMASVQRGLGERMGRDVVLVSISVDPANDTPAAMRAYAQRMKAGKDWLWLTGNAGDIARVLRAFGLTAGRPNDHPPLVLVGDPVNDRWMRWVGVPTPAAVVDGANAMIVRAAASTAPSATNKAPANGATSSTPQDPHAHHRPSH